ncbi:MAG: AlpA family phage regulatory protein [Pelagimonas sp.]|jgi:prophage regulatory protein|nr:AlpA family phage regulatory protein [Pelagimonas sp.]
MNRTNTHQPKVHDFKKTLLDAPDVMALLGVSRATLYRFVKAGTFPAPLKITRNMARWHVDTVEQWIAEQVAKAQGQTAA